jgi:hypothetical protein
MAQAEWLSRASIATSDGQRLKPDGLRKGHIKIAALATCCCRHPGAHWGCAQDQEAKIWLQVECRELIEKPWRGVRHSDQSVEEIWI